MSAQEKIYFKILVFTVYSDLAHLEKNKQLSLD